MTKVLACAVEQYRRRVIMRLTNTAYGALRADPDSWAELEAERDEWDATIADGLGNDPPLSEWMASRGEVWLDTVSDGYSVWFRRRPLPNPSRLIQRA